MNAAGRLTAFGAALVAVLASAYGVGVALSSPVDSTAADTHAETEDAAHGGGRQASSDASAEVLGGLAKTDRGYEVRLDYATLPSGDAVPVGFTVTAPDGESLSSYEVEHEKELHLIAVRRDFSGYQHVHPTREASGRWSAPLDLTTGSWRLFADFVPGDGGAPEGLTLGTDLEVGGAYTPAPASSVSAETTVGDYTVALNGVRSAGVASELTFSVARDGQPVTTEPYLGARGHLVALREGDLAYLHVHPDEDSLSFAATFPTAGRYRLFLDVKVDGQVWTAAFTVEVAE